MTLTHVFTLAMKKRISREHAVKHLESSGTKIMNGHASYVSENKSRDIVHKLCEWKQK